MSRRAVAALVVLLGATQLAPGPAHAGADSADVTMNDNWYDPVATVVRQGELVEFTNFGQVAHDAKDDTGLGLFDTGLLTAPDTAIVGPLPGAGRYTYVCTFHPGMAGALAVPVRLSHTHRSVGAVVTVRWAAARAPEGLVFDVQRRRPGSARFVTWRSGVTGAATNWRPAIRGRWLIRARVRAAVGDGASDWSVARTLQVS
jgi:plastocyanin